MKILQLTTQFKRDLKRYKHNLAVIDKLDYLLDCLANEHPIPKEYKPHQLSGDYRGYLECHVENDVLLVWLDLEINQIKLVRLGSHSELFGKGVKR